MNLNKVLEFLSENISEIPRPRINEPVVQRESKFSRHW